MLVASFVALGTLWRRPVLERAAAGRELPEGVQRVLLSPVVRIAVGAVSVALLALVAAAALVGDERTLENIAPTFVWVVFWLGLVPVVVLFGNVWAAISPFRAVADAVAWLGRRAGIGWTTEQYPERLGRWPAAGLLFAFVAMELVYSNPASPRALALAIYLYAAVTWLGMILFGRRAWLEHGEAFHVYFGLLGRIAPLAVEEREGRRRVIVRPPLSGLATVPVVPGTLAFVALMLGSVGFDSVSRTSLWLDLELEAGSEPARLALGLAGLAGTILVVALAYLGAVRLARSLTHSEARLAPAFVTSLVPIALVYVVAHYFSLLILQGQYLVPLVSDPFGRGLDLLGTAGFVPDLALLTPNVTWYAQVAALVAGHVGGLVVAHDRAVAIFRSPGDATRSQYAMLVLMVLYTVGGMRLLATG